MRRIDRVLMVTWEYPPRVVGTIAPHCESLARGLAKRGVAVEVATFDDWHAGTYKDAELGITVRRVTSPIAPCTSTLTWVLTMSVELERAGSDAFHDAKGAVDVVHAHDWIALPAAIALSHAFQSPLVVTLHSIESQRSGGSRSPYLEAIRKIEWQGAFEAARVIVDREAMLAEVVREYQVPEQKVDIIDPAGREAVALALKAYREACL